MREEILRVELGEGFYLYLYLLFLFFVMGRGDGVMQVKAYIFPWNSWRLEGEWRMD